LSFRVKAIFQSIMLQEMDHFFNEAQRQGRISFYMQAAGEEAIHFGCAAALNAGGALLMFPAGFIAYLGYRIPDDEVFAQYREQGVLMWRGFSLQNFADQVRAACASAPVNRAHSVVSLMICSAFQMLTTLARAVRCPFTTVLTSCTSRRFLPR
jgi:TPP-dependent pyruvate/acetoin dehydrogenase alpha subunit